MLYLIATPIGNLNDITLRALDTLRQVDVIASEDTRKTGLLLKHFSITKPQIAFHEHNEQRAGERIEVLLKEGKSVAVVTNAGTPGISDPGFTLVRRAINAQVAVTTVDQPSVADLVGARTYGFCDGPGALRITGSQLHLLRLSTAQICGEMQIYGNR